MSEAIEALKNIRAGHYGKRCRNWKESIIYILLSFFVVAIFLSVLGLLGYGMLRQRAYWTYVEELSGSTTYAYTRDTLRVTEGENSYLLTGEEVYIPYRLLGDIVPGRPWREEPTGRDTIHFDFGDGSSLQIWDVPIEDSTKGYEYGLYVRYCNQKGKTFQFDLDGVTITDIRNGLAKSRRDKEQ